jgi:hypothetical protein
MIVNDGLGWMWKETLVVWIIQTFILKKFGNPHQISATFLAENHTPPNPVHPLISFHVLTTWSGVVLEKLMIVQLDKKLPAFYKAQKFITVSTRASH